MKKEIREVVYNNDLYLKLFAAKEVAERQMELESYFINFTNPNDSMSINNPFMDESCRFPLNLAQAEEIYGSKNVHDFIEQASVFKMMDMKADLEFCPWKAFRDKDTGYFMIQECEDGWDYTFYDEGLNDLDGGVLCNPDLSIMEATAEILEDQNTFFEDITELDQEDFEEQLERKESSLMKEREYSTIIQNIQTPYVNLERFLRYTPYKVTNAKNLELSNLIPKFTYPDFIICQDKTNNKCYVYDFGEKMLYPIKPVHLYSESEYQKKSEDDLLSPGFSFVYSAESDDFHWYGYFNVVEEEEK